MAAITDSKVWCSTFKTITPAEEDKILKFGKEDPRIGGVGLAGCHIEFVVSQCHKFIYPKLYFPPGMFHCRHVAGYEAIMRMIVIYHNEMVTMAEGSERKTETIRDLTITVKRLQGQNLSLISEKAALLQKATTCETEATSLRKELANTAARADSVASELKKTKEENTTLVTANSSQQLEIMRLQAELQKLSAEFAKTKADLAQSQLAKHAVFDLTETDKTERSKAPSDVTENLPATDIDSDVDLDNDPAYILDESALEALKPQT